MFTITDGGQIQRSGRLEPADFFGLELSRGRIGNVEVIHKFGRAIVGTTFTPLCFGGFYRTPTTATSLEVVSSGINDTAAGTGARTFTAIGLDANWQEVSQTVNMNGTTAVPLPTDLIRLYRFFVETSGTYATQTSGSHAGDITVRVAGAGDVWGVLDSTDFALGQSEVAAYSVEAGYTAYVPFVSINVDSGKTGSILFFVRTNADTVVAPYGVMKGKFRLGGLVGNAFLEGKSPLGGFVGPCDIGFLAKVSATTGEIDADFEIWKIKN